MHLAKSSPYLGRFAQLFGLKVLLRVKELRTGAQTSTWVPEKQRCGHRDAETVGGRYEGGREWEKDSSNGIH